MIPPADPLPVATEHDSSHRKRRRHYESTLRKYYSGFRVQEVLLLGVLPVHTVAQDDLYDLPIRPYFRPILQKQHQSSLLSPKAESTTSSHARCLLFYRQPAPGHLVAAVAACLPPPFHRPLLPPPPPCRVRRSHQIHQSGSSRPRSFQSIPRTGYMLHQPKSRILPSRESSPRRL